jgi:hypothetical protein
VFDISQVQGQSDFTAFDNGPHAPQKRQAPLGLVSAVGPTGSHLLMLRWLCP